MEVAGTTFLVTGAWRGIGRAMAVELADRGGRVLAGTREETAAGALGDQRLRPVRVDLASRESIDSSCDALSGELNRIDALVNNAGAFTVGQLETQEIAEMYDVFQVNLAGLAHLTRRVLPAMLKRGSGKIVNQSSLVA